MNKIRRAEDLQKRVASYRPPKPIIPTYDAQFGAWLTGFTDGEGSFVACITKAGGLSLQFLIKLRKDDRSTLETIQSTLSIGYIYDGEPSPDCKLRAKPSSTFTVRKTIDLYQRIVPHFDQYPLRSKKKKDYEIWREIVVAVAHHYRTTKTTILDEIGHEIRPMVENLQECRRYE